MIGRTESDSFVQAVAIIRMNIGSVRGMELADQYGFEDSAIRRWVADVRNGRRLRVPPLDMAIRVSRAYDVELPR
jgi:hypothetical protein